MILSHRERLSSTYKLWRSHKTVNTRMHPDGAGAIADTHTQTFTTPLASVSSRCLRNWLAMEVSGLHAPSLGSSSHWA